MKRRGSGILLHVTSLPSPYGIGDLGPWAYRFAGFLIETNQGYWQILPLNPTRINWANSPYSSPSAYAGNPLLISPEYLVEENLLSKSDLNDFPALSEERVDYRKVLGYKKKLFHRAYQRFKDRKNKPIEFESFCQKHSHWLEDYALFTALKGHLGERVWSKWPKDIRDRRAKSLNILKEKLRERVEKEKFFQHLFFKQWFALKDYCNSRGIQIIGDVPIYVNYDSADVWAHPELFKLGANKKPLAVAGIPFDYFSLTGQLWGNPIYRWDVLKEMRYAWWVKRIAHNLKLFDLIRLDHFKGFVDYWEVPVRDRTAANGKWIKGPGEDFFNTLRKHFPSLPFIAEDLGVITPEVHALRDRFEFPGMRVLQFAFGNDPLAEEYKPHSYIQNCMAYTGTHDNDTLMGWLYGREDYSTREAHEIERERKNALNYLGYRNKRRKMIHWEFIRLLMMSTAHVVIFPMQDLLGLGEEARMNRPATSEGNWEWRVSPDQLRPSMKRRLSEMTKTYGRD